MARYDPSKFRCRSRCSGDKLIGSGEVSFNYTDFGIEQPSILGLKAGNMVKTQLPYRRATRAGGVL